MALIEGFRSTNIWKAFVLNSIAAALVIFVAIAIKGQLDNYTDEHGNTVTRSTNVPSVVVTLVVTFVASMAAYTALHFIFGYGGGQLASA